jgi:hypothetical protein
MMRNWKSYLWLALLVTVVAVTPAGAQESGRGNRGPDGRRDAAQTRRALEEILNEWYPPTLRRVLQLDPSLLSNASYLMAYPELNSFLMEHPDVGRNPTYYLGTPEDERNVFVRPPESEWENVFEMLSIIAVTFAITGTILWIIRAAVNHRRWLRLTRLQTEAQTKIMDRFSSNDDLLAFIQTPAGKRFLESSAVPLEPQAVAAPVGRILWSVQAGLILLVTGMGIEFVSSQVEDMDAARAFFVIGVLVIAVGFGFILSSLASYELSRRLGLFSQPETPQTPSS